jgi:hypothetical protein
MYTVFSSIVFAQLLVKVTEIESIQAKLRDQEADDMLASDEKRTIAERNKMVQCDLLSLMSHLSSLISRRSLISHPAHRLHS